jgi:hypothetical protein
MNKKSFLPILIATLMTTLFLIRATASAEEGHEESPTARNPKYMFIDEIKVGMKGYGLTVFSGTKIEKFDVEIIGVIYDIGPQSNIILSRISGGPIDKTGVIAGMSGSPIYVDGRIIGALAFSWPFSKEPIAGITPIDEMLRIFAFEGKAKRERIASNEGPHSAGWAQAAKFSVALPAMASESVEMTPIMTPMVFSGFSKEVVDYFRPELEGWGIIPVVGGSSAGHLDEEAPFEEGAAVGVQLVSGDLSASAIGTVTVKDGDKVLAFGHPFLLSGSVDFPMTTAYVHAILPSMVVSTKMSTALKSVGAMTQDREDGIAGVLGGSPQTVPVTLKIHRKGQNSAQTLNFEIARSRQLLPAMAGMALSGSFSRAASTGGEFSASVRYEVEVEGFPTIHKVDYISGLSGFPSLASLGLFRDLMRLLNNQFEELIIKSINMEVEVQEAVDEAQIMGVRMWKDTLKPGEDLTFKIVMKPYMKQQIEKDYHLRIPVDFPEGQAYVQISAAPQTEAFERMRSPYHFQPTSAAKLVELVSEDYPGNRMDVRVLVTDPGIVIRGEEMQAIPSSVFSVISQTVGKEAIGITRSSVLLQDHVPLDFAIEGSITIPITIDRKAP